MLSKKQHRTALQKVPTPCRARPHARRPPGAPFLPRLIPRLGPFHRHHTTTSLQLFSGRPEGQVTSFTGPRMASTWSSTCVSASCCGLGVSPSACSTDCTFSRTCKACAAQLRFSWASRHAAAVVSPPGEGSLARSNLSQVRRGRHKQRCSFTPASCALARPLIPEGGLCTPGSHPLPF